MKNLIFYAFYYPFDVFYNFFYYLKRYFKIRKLVTKRVEYKLMNNPEYKKYNKIKLVIATSYVVLISNLVADLVNKKKVNFELNFLFNAIIDSYLMTIIFDDDIDEDENISVENKIKRINDIFEVFKKMAIDPYNYNIDYFSTKINNELILFLKTYNKIWQKEYEVKMLKGLDKVRKAYINECLVSSKYEAWKSLLEISKVTIDFFGIFIYMMYPDKKLDNSDKLRLYYFMFAGNVIDDWMDYYWTKEDHGKNKYIDYIRRETNWIFKKPIFLYPKSFLIMFFKLSKELWRIHHKYRFNRNSNWIFLSFSLLLIITSPLSIYLHLKEKK